MPKKKLKNMKRNIEIKDDFDWECCIDSISSHKTGELFECPRSKLRKVMPKIEEKPNIIHDTEIKENKAMEYFPNANETLENTVMSESRRFQTTNFKTAAEVLKNIPKKDQYVLCVPNMEAKLDWEMSKTKSKFILRWVAIAMQTFKLTSKEDCIEIAKLLVKAYPKIQTGKDDGICGIVASISHWFNLNANKNPNPKNQTENTIEITSTEKLTSEEILIDASKSILDSFREQRIERAKKESPAEHLKMFPCLKNDELLFWEFCQLEKINVTRDELKIFWLRHLPKMNKYFSLDSNPITDAISEVHATAKVLQNMTHPKFFGSKKTEEHTDRSQKVLEIFNEGTPNVAILPERTDPPRLIAVGDPSKDDFKVSIFIEQQPFFSGLLLDSLIQLTAIYHVFQASPAPNAKASFSFLFKVFLKQCAKKDC